MLTRDDARFLFAYNRWANGRTLDTASPLSPEEFRRNLHSSFSSIRDTLAHILAAEWIWLERWRGTSPKVFLDANEFPGLPSLRERWATLERGQSKLLASVDDAALARDLSYVNTKGETWTYALGRMMQHVVNHSSYHRGQVAAMLRQLGHRPVSTDLLVFLDEGAPGDEGSAPSVR